MSSMQFCYFADKKGEEIVRKELLEKIGMRFESKKNIVDWEENYKLAKAYFEKIGIACPKCGKDIVLKKTKKGRKYYGCEDNPDCDYMSWQKPSGKLCPKCGTMLVEKGNKLVCPGEACNYVENK